MKDHEPRDHRSMNHEDELTKHKVHNTQSKHVYPGTTVLNKRNICFTGHVTDQNRGQVHVDNIKLYPRKTRGTVCVCASVHLFWAGTCSTKCTRLLCTAVLRLTSLPLLPPQWYPPIL